MKRLQKLKKKLEEKKRAKQEKKKAAAAAASKSGKASTSVEDSDNKDDEEALKQQVQDEVNAFSICSARDSGLSRNKGACFLGVKIINFMRRSSSSSSSLLLSSRPCCRDCFLLLLLRASLVSVSASSFSLQAAGLDFLVVVSRDKTGVVSRDHPPLVPLVPAGRSVSAP